MVTQHSTKSYKIFRHLMTTQYVFLAHLSKAQMSLCHGSVSVVSQIFPLNHFFSKTTRLISTKF